MATIHSKNIPNFIKAKSPRGLRSLMIRNNTKRGKFFDYFDIQFVKGSWFAWYYDDQVTLEDFKK